MSLCQCAVKHSESDAEGCCFSASGGLKVCLHWSGEEERERCQTYAQGTLSAEEICIDLARRIGERRRTPALFRDRRTRTALPPGAEKFPLSQSLGPFKPLYPINPSSRVVFPGTGR
ncbi:hypothetical protein QYF61_021510 [Mycteria americana]|uniref:FERM F1 lobe ubiquitin-like domain-containing protein n=1 Tax=Mycteria americana TaxID=33587 RepID=A0AAN7MKN1_MYCAM|nr:hypothetical protein QYF61_021510 [Mycteria americana]